MIEKYREWEPLEVLQGSPNGAVTHLALYQETMRSYYGASRPPICMPKPLARVGIAMREVLGRMTGHMPFERSWMGEYIDMQLTVDASHTHRRLGWRPNPELEILKRIPFMVHNMLHHSDEWRERHNKWKQARGRQYQFATASLDNSVRGDTDDGNVIARP